MVLVQDLLETVNKIVKGRLLNPGENATSSNNPYAVLTSSGIPGKEVWEHPGLVYGNLSSEVRKVAVTLSLTESHIEQCGFNGVNVIVVHHPVADAASSGGIPLKSYLDFYGISLIEVHQALHGIHPGRTEFYGLKSLSYIKSYKTKGVNFHHAKMVPSCTVGEFIERIRTTTGLVDHQKMSSADRIASGWPINDIVDSLPAILCGEANNKVDNVLEVFPQSGFTPYHLEESLKDFGKIDTIFQPCAPVTKDHELIKTASEMGLNYILGGYHGFETYENGLPLAYSIKSLQPELEVLLIQQRIFSLPIEKAGNKEMLSYAEDISKNYLL